MKIKKLFNGTEINEKEFMEWLNEGLRSGKYPQTTGRLQDDKGYCCLGVACELLMPKNRQARYDSRYLVGTYPISQYNSPKWLKVINRDFYRRTGMGLTTLNDSMELSFDEIADCLEAVYILGVLE